MYQELIEYIVKGLVSNASDVVVTETITEDRKHLEVEVAKADMGRVIGKDGRIIRSIRELVNAYASKAKEKVFVDVKEK